MERHELEDRIRASLQARADDVQPTPELWERVSERTTRRARWALGGWVMSGAAAVVAIVVGGMVLFGGPRSVQIDQQPDIADTPTDAPVPGPTADPTIVTTDGQLLRVVEPGTGEVQLEVDPRAGLAEGATIEELAVRPDTGDGMLTVASVIEVEGSYDIDVTVIDPANGERVDRQPIGMGVPATDLPPDVVWSQDGRYLMWAGSSTADDAQAGPALWAYDWTERPADDIDGRAAVTVTAPGADGALFSEGGTVDLRTWQGPSDGESVVVATSPTGGAWRIGLAAQTSDCGGATPCPPTWNAAISPIGFEGGSLADVATLASGIDLSLVARSGQPGDAEGGTLALLAGAMGDQQRELDVPELVPGGSAAPTDGWLAAAGDQVAVGFGPVTGYLLTVTGDTIEDVEVAGTVALPEGTTAASMALPATGDDATSAPDGTATEDTALADGVPGHVVRVRPRPGPAATGRPRHRRGRCGLGPPRRPGWPRPSRAASPCAPAARRGTCRSSRAGPSARPSRWPGPVSVPARWSRNEVLPDTMQPTNTGTIAERAESNPVFSPDGTWLAWVETPQGAASSAQVRFVPWSEDGPVDGAQQAALASDDSTRPVELLDWAAESGQAAVLTLRPATEPGTDAQQPSTMIELRLPGGGDPRRSNPDVDVGGPAGRALRCRLVPLRGRHRALHRLRRRQRRAGRARRRPGSAVPSGAVRLQRGPACVAFGPGDALVQRADGAWQRVQLDDGATSAVEVPDGTVAVLPWSTTG